MHAAAGEGVIRDSENLEGEGADTLGGGIVVGVAGKQPGEAGVDDTVGESGVGGPQFGERLRDVKDFITYVSAPDRLTTAGELAGSNPFSQDAEKRDFVADTTEERVGDTEVGKEWEPNGVPDFGGGLGA